MTENVVIPITDALRTKIWAFVESMISIINDGKVDPDNEEVLFKTFKDVLEFTIPYIPTMVELGEFEREFGKNIASAAMVEAMTFIIDELQKNKVLFKNRQVLVNAIRGEMMKDNRQFLVTGENFSHIMNDDISEYTSDPRILKAYASLLKKFKNLGNI